MHGAVKRALVIGGGVLLVGIVAALVWVATAAEEEERVVAEGDPEMRFPDVDPYEFFREEDGDGAPEPSAEAPAPGTMMGFDREAYARLSPEERRAKRREMRERWRNMTPEERQAARAERANRRVSIQATGEGEPALQPTDVMDSMRDVRPQIRDCVEQNGGWRALREASAGAADGGVRGPMNLSFDVAADGAVSGVAMNPAPPGAFAQCFESAFQGLEMPAPGAEARVDVQLGRGGGGRRERNGRGTPTVGR
ncbi:MAG: hypothetical protein CMN30_28550 [Sandaracinus sp.]|nr:hypothetical protein [Sandaracinus sp.]MAR57089.1 hypothetical protein [Rickettsiales bacterium]|tara:strand:- start:366 stop:1124 length:759 start_codon:yes stop_codon:yes gene_type:complete